MWRAALPCGRTGIALLGSIFAAVLALEAASSGSSAAAAVQTGPVWALALPDSAEPVTRSQLSWLAARGVTAIVAGRSSRQSLRQLTAIARRARMIVIAPQEAVREQACATATGALHRCASRAATPKSAVRLARCGLVEFVLVRVRTPLQLRMLRGSGARRSRIVAVLPLASKTAARGAWKAGVSFAAADPALDLAVSSAPAATASLSGYLARIPRTRTASAAGPAAPASVVLTARSTSSITLRWTPAAGGAAGYGVYIDGAFVLDVESDSITLTGLACGRTYSISVDAFAAGARSARASTTAGTEPCPTGGGSGGGSDDALPPSAPLGFAVTATTPTSISVSWTASTDNVAVAGYGLYRGGSLVGTALVTSYSYAGLTCGTTYALEVDAYDARGNRSGRTSVSAATSACVSGGDTTPPSAVGALTRTGSTATSISVSWSASSDNVRVTGYGLYRNGAATGSTTSTSATFGGLACGSSYTLAVDAYDAAGNRSSRTSLTTATSPCPAPADAQPPSAPQGMAFATVDQTSVRLVWNASSDNVGVVGYRLFRGGLPVATVAVPGYTFTALTCGTSYTFALEAYDAAGNASDRAAATGTTSTSACGGGSPPPPPPPPPGPGPAPTVANLWVDVNGGSCVRQPTAGAYGDAQACGWNAAYQAAQTGDVILVKGGNYGDVTIGPNRVSISAPGVTFRTASGESVVVNDLENGNIAGASGGSNVSFVGPATARTFRSDRASNVVVDGWNVDCNGCDGVQIFHVEAANNVTVKNSEIQDNNNNSLIWISGSNITFENNRIHDAGLPAGSAAHTECMYAWEVTNLTLRRNHFYRCSVMDVFITGGSVASGGLVENNVFEKPWENTGVVSQSALAFQFRTGGDPSPDPSNWDFRYNTFVGPLNISPAENPVGTGGMRVIGNVFLSDAPCGQPNTTYAYNAFVSGACGSNAITNSLATYLAGFAGTGYPGNYGLLPGSVLRDRGNPSDYPPTDRAGTARYSGAAPDLGAFEGT